MLVFPALLCHLNSRPLLLLRREQSLERKLFRALLWNEKSKRRGYLLGCGPSEVYTPVFCLSGRQSKSARPQHVAHSCQGMGSTVRSELHPGAPLLLAVDLHLALRYLWFAAEEAEEPRDEVSHPIGISGVSIPLEVRLCLEQHRPMREPPATCQLKSRTAPVPS